MAFQLKPTTTEPAIRIVMMPRDTNGQGTIFGGVILSLIDQAAYVEAYRQRDARYVTVAMREVEFKHPVFVGDVLSLYSRVVRAGRSSITIRVRVCTWRKPDADTMIDVTEAEVVLVAVDEDGNPIQVFAA
ncbi:MAG: acyl-CoA thioesterase [Phycisphaerae bacterium]